MSAFYVEEHLLYKGHYKVSLNEEVYAEITAEEPLNSSFNILASRLMSMSYDTFLQLIRQEYGAVLHGKTGYVSYTFPKRSDAERLIKELNKRWNCLMFVKNGKPSIV